MNTNLSKALTSKQTESNLSIDALAKAVGVSTVSVRGVLSGKSNPNAKTAAKYAKFLGLEMTDVSPAKKVHAGKKAKKKAAEPKAARTNKAPNATAKRSKTKVKANAPQLGLGAELVSAVSAAAGVLDDRLALAVHTAGKIERELIARLLRIG